MSALVIRSPSQPQATLSLQKEGALLKQERYAKKGVKRITLVSLCIRSAVPSNTQMQAQGSSSKKKQASSFYYQRSSTEIVGIKIALGHSDYY